MRKISSEVITEKVKNMCMDSNYDLSKDIYKSLEKAEINEKSPIGKNILKDLLKNADLAREKKVPMCQDTGMVVVFVEIGEDIFVEGNIKEAINKGISLGYSEGYLRKSVVNDPILRENTKDNTPGVIYYDFVPGDKLKISIAPKGFGSENMGQLKMLKPSDGLEGVKDFVLKVVSEAGPNPCPPIVVGVGIGGTMDKVTQIAKKALIRPINKSSKIDYVSKLENELLKEINGLGIGPQGLGGSTTALGVNIEVFPTHIAGLPVAVNINCHASRHMEVII